MSIPDEAGYHREAEEAAESARAINMVLVKPTVVLSLATLFAALTSCRPSVEDVSTLPEPSIDSSLLVGDYMFVAKNSMRSQCPPGIYMITHTVSPLALSIAEDRPFSLSNDTLALALLDSMHNGANEGTRRFYFWIVSRSLKSSDGYYSEGVGVTGTSFLFRRPSEFISSWKDCLTIEERDGWVYYLAAEQSITSEGSPADSVLVFYRDSLEQVTKNLPSEMITARDSLLVRIGRKLRLLKSIN